MNKDDINSKLQDMTSKLGAFAGTAIDKTAEIAHTATKKSKEAIEVTKINLKISEEKGYIRQKYEKVGKILYDKYEHDIENAPEDVRDIIAEITVGFDTIKLYNNRIEDIKNAQPSSSESDDDSDFRYDNNEITPDDIEEDICDMVDEVMGDKPEENIECTADIKYEEDK